MKSLFVPIFDLHTSSKRMSFALLALRLIVGIAFILHGYGKITSAFSWMGPDAPIPGILQALVALAEFGGGVALILGLLTPISSLGLIFTMAGAVYFHVAKGDSFVQGYELAMVYLVMSIAIFLMGPGLFSFDAFLNRKR